MCDPTARRFCSICVTLFLRADMRQRILRNDLRIWFSSAETALSRRQRVTGSAPYLRQILVRVRPVKSERLICMTNSNYRITN
jgi:hypothetical protein